VGEAQRRGILLLEESKRVIARFGGEPLLNTLIGTLRISLVGASEEEETTN
jgi:hypothetical protein